jgi:4-hydroxybenzoate polyprenyltransferase
VNNWKIFLRLGRLSNLPTVWSNVLAGAVLAGQVQASPLAWLLPAASLFYVAGMFLNDAFDKDVDAIERPERPIPSGQISASAVFIIGFVMMMAGLALLLPLGWNAAVAGLALCACILFYDMHHKKNPLSPLVMGVCRALLYLLAAAGVAGNMPWMAAALITAYVAGLTYTARQENLLEFENAWPLVIFAFPLLWVTLSASAAAIPFLLLFLGWTAYALRMVLLREARNIRKAVGAMIAGISLLDAVLIAEAGQPELAIVAVAAFALTLLLHRSIPGT